ncbi:MAG: right-handed parallel beta-helix repeat-containing protein [Planctomycetes bacterium]|nr:right-handed parallel beta-helix repeat-containing protein [Planctomycetota bacterium]
MAGGLAATGVAADAGNATAGAAAEFAFEDGLGAGAWGDKRYAKLEKDAPLAGKQSLLIDTMANSGEWNPAWHTPAGLLQGGKSYHVSMTVKLLEKRAGFPAYFMLLLRPIGANNHHSDAGMVVVKDLGERKLAFRVNVPEKPANYAIQLHTHFGLRALVDDVRVAEANDQFVPADDGAKAAMPEKLPTGAAEFTVKLPNAAKAKVFNARDFGVTPEAENNGPALLAAIAKIRKQCPARLVLEPGVYRVKGVGLVFDSVHDFTFDGQGATLVFSGIHVGHLIAINHCDQVAFRNFTVDWDWDADPIASLVKAEKVSADGKACVFRFTGYQKFPVKDVRVASVSRLAPGTLDDDPARPFGVSLEFFKGQKKPATRWLGDNLLEVATPGPEFAKAAPGDEFRMRHYVYDHNAIAMLLNRDLTLEGVTIASAPGMGLLVNGAQQNWQFLGVKIVPAPGRCLSTTADAIHVGSSRGNFRMENCEIAHSADDAINIHDLGGYAVKLDDHRIRATNLNFHPGNYFQPGHLIELRHADFSPTGFTAKLKEVKNARRPNLEMVFEEKLPEPIGGGFAIFNRNYGTRNVIIRNNRIHHFPRGLLLMADDVTVENNEFVNGQAAGVKLETGYTASVWSEGFGVNNVVIRNNLFERVNRRGRYPNENRPDIYVNSYIQTDPSLVKTSYPIIRNVLIAGNRFVNSTGSPVYVCTAGDVTIADNLFSNPDPCPVEEGKRGTIGASYAQNLQVLNNRWEGKYGRAGVFYDPATVSGLRAAGNQARAGMTPAAAPRP